MCGLCGNYNGISEDEFVGRHKTNYSTAVDFANSWQRGQSTCGMPTESNIIPQISCAFTNPDMQTWIEDRCRTLRSYIIASQCRVIEDITIYHSQCIDKLCSCSSPHGCYCKSATYLLKVCQPITEDSSFENDVKSTCDQL